MQGVTKRQRGRGRRNATAGRNAAAAAAAQRSHVPARRPPHQRAQASPQAGVIAHHLGGLAVGGEGGGGAAGGARQQVAQVAQRQELQAQQLVGGALRHLRLPQQRAQRRLQEAHERRTTETERGAGR